MKIVTYILVCLCSLASCKTAPKEKNSVIVTISPYRYLVSRISGESIPIKQLIPPQANPHIFEPTPRHVEDLSSCKIWFFLGEAAEKRIYDALLFQNPNLKIVKLTEGIDLLGGDIPESKDLHIWLSPNLLKKQADNIAKALSEAFPEKAHFFDNNLKSLQEELSSLDSEIQKKLGNLSCRYIITAHAALGYFCKDYNLIQLSLEQEGKEALPKQITEILQESKGNKINCVLLEPNHNNKGAILVASELGVPYYMFDPLKENCLENLQYLTWILGNANRNQQR